MFKSHIQLHHIKWFRDSLTSFIGFLYLSNVGIATKTMSLRASQADRRDTAKMCQWKPFLKKKPFGFHLEIF